MKICVRCEATVADPMFRCVQCGWTPTAAGSIPVLAPELDAQLDDYPSGYFDELRELEDGHFWFENRNRLIQWALGEYFPNAFSFFELGCGTGFVLKGIAQKYPYLNLTGGDPATAALRHARTRLPQATLLQLDGRRLPFRGEMDVIGAFDVIEHIQEDVTVLQEIRRASTAGGGMIVTVPQHDFLWSALDEHARHKRRYSRAALMEKVKSAGFEVLHVTSFVSLLLPAMLAVRLRKRGLRSDQIDPAAEFRIGPRLNRGMARILGAERQLIRMGLEMPFGGSLLLVARAAHEGER